MMSLSIRGKREQKVGQRRVSFVKAQLALFQSRKKFSFLYCLATVTGLFCLPGVFEALASPTPNFLIIIQMTLPLPLASLLVTAGTYIMNDLLDADLDRANGKKRPIPSGLVSKRQAWAFVAFAFGAAVLLTMVTFSPISMVIVTLMLGIGVTYSLPPVVLMKRFIVKTVSIAVFYILCALLGMTSVFNFDLGMDSPALITSVLLTLALMVFISSTLNDMGDVDGDRAAGRRTIPIVVGKENTIKLTMILAGSVLAITWAFFVTALIAGHSSPVTAATTTAIASIILMTLSKMRKGFQNAKFMRSQHKKLFPLQIMIHPSLITGVSIF
jgi:geranylgeranylglycerol-phosphate geranylgeranyltransferase